VKFSVSHLIAAKIKKMNAVLVVLCLFGFGQSPSAAAQVEPPRRIVITKHNFTLRLFKGDSLEKSYPVAVGKNAGDKERVGDCRTPVGAFYISQIQDARAWTHDFNDGKGIIKGAYGPWFLRLYTGADKTRSGKAWTGIGIHGTHAPESIGTAATEGCIRLRNSDLQDLKSRVKVGVPVIIE
jgi:lipoprotein-anchoring transpeptidase ErfK/SrfK